MKSLPAATTLVSASEQQNLRLNRIGVLEFVDEDPGELLLQVARGRRRCSRIRSRARASRSVKSSAPAARFSS